MAMLALPDGKNKHFSFLILRSKIIAIGHNNYYITHPVAQKYGYRFNAIHSELACLLKFKGDNKTLKKCKIVNIRINRFGHIGMSKPCPICEQFLRDKGFKTIIFSGRDGNFHTL